MKYLVNNLKTNWKNIIDQEFNKEYMKKIDNFLFKEKNVIFPERKLIFKAFDFFNIEETKVVFIGQDPYPKEGQANGLCFSVNEGSKIPRSLANLFKKLFIELSIERKDSNLENWAKQGFLLLNKVLTIEKDKINSHKQIGWELFVSKIVDVLNNNDNKILFVFLGSEIKKMHHLIDKKKHQILNICHPSPLSAYKNGFFITPFFEEINSFLEKEYKTKMNW